MIMTVIRLCTAIKDSGMKWCLVVRDKVLINVTIVLIQGIYLTFKETGEEQVVVAAAVVEDPMAMADQISIISPNQPGMSTTGTLCCTPLKKQRMHCYLILCLFSVH